MRACASGAVITREFCIPEELEVFSTASPVCRGLALELCSRAGAEGSAFSSCQEGLSGTVKSSTSPPLHRPERFLPHRPCPALPQVFSRSACAQHPLRCVSEGRGTRVAHAYTMDARICPARTLPDTTAGSSRHRMVTYIPNTPICTSTHV